MPEASDNQGAVGGGSDALRKYQRAGKRDFGDGGRGPNSRKPSASSATKGIYLKRLNRFMTCFVSWARSSWPDSSAVYTGRRLS